MPQLPRSGSHAAGRIGELLRELALIEFEPLQAVFVLGAQAADVGELLDEISGLRAQVLAPGFAPAWAEVTKPSVLVTLRVAAAAENVTTVLPARLNPARVLEVAEGIKAESWAG